MARLVEDGKLDLDAPIQKYAPSFPVKSPNHRFGWRITTIFVADAVSPFQDFTVAVTRYAPALAG